MSSLVKPYERLDDLQINGLRIIQNPNWFSFGIDAVLLADYTNVKANQAVIDLGTGTGIIPLLLSQKTQASEIVGVELQQDVADMARRSVTINELNERISILTMDIREIPTLLKKGTFDVVTANPPYFKSEGGLKNDSDFKTISRHEVACTLEDLFRAAYFLLKPGGVFFMVHRPERLVDIVATARAFRLEPKQIRFVQPKVDAKPNIMLMRFVKYGREALYFDQPLVVYQPDGDYTQEIYSIYESAHVTVFKSKE